MTALIPVKLKKYPKHVLVIDDCTCWSSGSRNTGSSKITVSRTLGQVHFLIF
jgi:hypothetical protein